MNRINALLFLGLFTICSCQYDDNPKSYSNKVHSGIVPSYFKEDLALMPEAIASYANRYRCFYFVTFLDTVSVDSVIHKNSNRILQTLDSARIHIDSTNFRIDIQGNYKETQEKLYYKSKIFPTSQANIFLIATTWVKDKKRFETYANQMDSLLITIKLHKP
ncbi:MAG: hypothetical protein MUE53_02905 [Chitinophagales bacterium]|jgi:hypothetical protein|nr:hypothetical protein [Chitinophagales bacterium]